MSEIWPIGLPALIVVISGVMLIRRNWTSARSTADIGEATPAIPAERLRVVPRDLDRSRAGELVDPARPTLGGRLRQRTDPAMAETGIDRRTRVRARPRRRRPLTARDAA